MVTIREATLADAERIVRMAIRFLEETPYGGVVSADELKIAQLLVQCLDRGVIHIAEVDGRPEGFLAVLVGEHAISGEIYADEVAWWVEPEYRSGLLGPRLLSTTENWCSANALSFLKMVAPIGSSVATAYPRLGYQAIETSFMKRFSGGPVQRR